MELHRPKIIIVGLGTGSKDELTIGALNALKSGSKVILRTERHGIIPFLKEEGIDFTSMDDIYDKYESFDEIYPQMINRVLEQAEEGSVVVGVPGHPMVGERFVFDLLRELESMRNKGFAYECEVLSGISHAHAVLGKIGRGHPEGLKNLTAAELQEGQLDPGLPAIITGLDNPVLAGEVKLALLNVYPPELKVIHTRYEEDGSLILEEFPLHTLDHLRKFDHTSCLYLPALTLLELNRYRFRHLLEIMEILRSLEGCPWDREQTHESLKQYLIEETYEVLEAIDLKDMDKLAEELGDLLLQVVFHAQIAKEHGEFDIGDVLTGISQKLIRRHTHIFGSAEVDSSKQVVENWEAIKKQEKGLKSHTQVLKDIPSNLPALMRSYKVQKKAALVGFDWDNVKDAADKAREEFRELEEAYASGSKEKIREELGDLLFAIVNVSRFLEVEPELALTAAIEKFISRFEYIEEHADKPLEEMSLEEMEALWQQAKFPII